MYQKFTDDELIEVYTSTIEYGQQPSKDLSAAIEAKGGIVAFKKLIETKEIQAEEERRIAKEIALLTTPDTDVTLIRSVITSTIFSNEQLDTIVSKRFANQILHFNNKIVDAKTIILAVAAGILAVCVGATICMLLTLLTPIIWLLIIPIIYFFDYLIIRIVTKKTASNIIVLLTAVVSTIASVILSTIIVSKFFLPAS
jgi:hypothetical protein